MGAHESHNFYATYNVDCIKNDYNQRGEEQTNPSDLWNLYEFLFHTTALGADHTRAWAYYIIFVQSPSPMQKILIYSNFLKLLIKFHTDLIYVLCPILRQDFWLP
jgi:hypothetical protein